MGVKEIESMNESEEHMKVVNQSQGRKIMHFFLFKLGKLAKGTKTMKIKKPTNLPVPLQMD